MPSGSRLFYWDANVIIAYLGGEQDRIPDIEALLDEAQRGDIQILTSELTVVEVAWLADEKTNGALDSGAEAAIDALWEPSSPIKRVDFHPVVSRMARDLIRASISTPGVSLKAADAIHLATAKMMAVDEFHTYEREQTRERWSGLSGIDVLSPAAIQPQLTPQPPGSGSNSF
jgi:predicted nucleic acid-binding protein